MATTAIRGIDLKNNFKEFCDRAFHGEDLIISRPKNENIVLMSVPKYEEIQKVKNNYEYLMKLARGNEDIEKGNLVIKTIEDLEAFESQAVTG